MYLRRLKNLREDHDKTQQQIANYLGIKRQQYGLYENGTRTIPIDLLIELANYYNTSLDYICERNNNINKDTKSKNS